MPILTFELTNRRFFHEASASLITKKIAFEAKLERRSELTVKGKGTLKHGGVVILEGDHNDVVGQIHYYDGSVDSDTGGQHPHGFTIHTRLPPDSFRTVLDASLELSSVYLEFSTKLFEGGWSRGFGSDGSQFDWDVEKENPVTAEWITVGVVPRGKPIPEWAEPETIEAPAIPQPTQVVIDTENLVSQLKRLFWAVVIIGVLVLAKLYA